MHSPVKKHPFSSAALPGYFVAAVGIICSILGLAVLISWHAHLPLVIQVHPSFVPMQYNAALCMLFSGAGLCAFHWRQFRLAQVFGVLAAIPGGLTLCEDLFSINLGIDQFLFRSYITTQTLHPGRMAPATALCLLQIGLSLFLMGFPTEAKWRAPVLGAFSSIVIVICGAAVLGYAVDLPGAYGWGRFTRIALHTAGGLALAGEAIFVVAWNAGRKTGESTPRWMPIPMALAVLVFSLVFSQALAKKQTQGSAQAIKASAASVGSLVDVAMDTRIRSVQRMALRWGFSDHPTQAVWENYSSDSPDFQAVEWIDPSYIVRWAASRAADQTGELQDLMLEQKRRTAVKTARASHEPVVTPIVELPQGGPGFIICVPVYTGANFEGCIAGYFQARTFLDHYLAPSVAPGYTIAISEGSRAFYKRNSTPEPASDDWIFNSTLELPGTAWNVRVWPGPALVKEMESSIPGTFLLLGLLRAAVFGLIVYVAQKWSAQARQTTLLNRELQAALAEVRTLSGMLPICSGCKRIRDDSGYWNEIERYVSRHSEASFSHGICPECAKTFYESEGLEVPEDIIKAVETHFYD